MIPRQDLLEKDIQTEIFQSHKILIIEKERQHAIWLFEYLISKGYDVLLATNYVEGLSVLRTQAIKGIFLSLDGEGGNVLDLVGFIRRQYPTILLFVMSENLCRDAIRDSFSKGVTGFLSKPILYDHLQEALFSFVRERV